jgi:hypothetical protein
MHLASASSNESAGESSDVLDAILALQILIAWAGESLSEPPRLGWWRTDLVEAEGGGDLFLRLLPKTHVWAGLEAVRKVAIAADQRARLSMANPDTIRTLFFWGFVVDEKLNERLAIHKRAGSKPLDILPIPLDLNALFSKADLEIALKLPNQTVNFQVLPGGREIAGLVPDSLELQAKKLGAALLPLAEKYPMPFFRLDNGKGK